VIHNAAVGYREGHRLTADGLPHVFAINTLSAYILTALIERPKRLVYLSSGMHHHADANLDDILWKKRRWNGSTAYAESKLHDAMLPSPSPGAGRMCCRTALEPGWVPTKMGGPGAPDDMDQAHLTQAWLAASDDPKAKVTGRYFYHLKRWRRTRRPKTGASGSPHRDLHPVIAVKNSATTMPMMARPMPSRSPVII
jgi:NAD(P)-dependent dehydrogenase (short-subunit alcohol dehydrogenase family)